MQKIGNIHIKAFLNRQSLMGGKLKLHLRLGTLCSWFIHLLSALSKLKYKRDRILDLFGFNSAYDLILIGLLLMMALDCGKHDGCGSKRIQAISFQTLKSLSQQSHLEILRWDIQSPPSRKSIKPGISPIIISFITIPPSYIQFLHCHPAHTWPCYFFLLINSSSLAVLLR